MMPAMLREDRLAPEDRAKVFKRLWGYLRPYRKQVYLAWGLVITQTAATLAGPALVRWGVDRGAVDKNLSALNVAGFWYLIATVGIYVSGRAAILTMAKVGESFLRDLRERVFRHVSHLSLDYYERNRTGVIVSRVTADVDAMQELVGQGLSTFIVSGLLFLGACVVMVAMSWQLALVCLMLVPIVLRASIWYRDQSNVAYLNVRDRIGQTLTALQEGIVGVRVIQAFRQEPSRADRFSIVNQEQLRAQMHTEKLAAWYFPVIDMTQGIAMVAILLLGGYLANRGSVTIGVVIAFVLYMQNLFEPIQNLSQQFAQLQAAGAALKKLFGLLDEQPSVGERENPVELPESGAIVVDDVSFRYRADTPEVLSNVSLTIAPGERMALVGPTGAGKSTLAKLISRFYDPSEGSITFGGVDLRDGTLGSLRHRMVVVPQEGFLFSGTIRDNLRVARPDATDDEIVAALARYDLGDRIGSFTDGLDTVVNERGANFSAGERQLISIARCALADPAVMVLDEATSSLDLGTELMIEQALDRLMEGRTVIVIAHRLTTAERADRVAVCDEGRLVELGTHDELLAKGGAYAALYAAWIGEQAEESVVEANASAIVDVSDVAPAAPAAS
ncbi:MAG TPA: ABC transporter ATP-binding protein [Acidimicrobiales bacterium]|nr:ABC transporter ATP-binding protein [Acidimicrobiales bacterium]